MSHVGLGKAPGDKPRCCAWWSTCVADGGTRHSQQQMRCRPACLLLIPSNVDSLVDLPDFCDNSSALLRARPVWCQGEGAKTLNTGPARPYQTLSPVTVTVTFTVITGSGLRDTLGLN